ncbi:MAG: hypothetical protein JOZ83_15805 [Silvibacterium sp.]|nr:hypothetical protein [Silvibacterium sp.]
MKNVLRTLAFTGIVAVAAVAGSAKAQAQVGIAIQIAPQDYSYYGGYVPACPGPDFYWTGGYYTGNVWVPGRWVHRDRYYVRNWDEHSYHRDWDDRYYGRDYDRHDYDRDRDYDHRGWEHGRR